MKQDVDPKAPHYDASVSYVPHANGPYLPVFHPLVLKAMPKGNGSLAA